MRQILVTGCILVMAALAAHADTPNSETQAPPADGENPQIETYLADLNAAIQLEGCAPYLTTIKPLVTDARFSNIRDDGKATILGRLVMCAESTGDKATTLKYISPWIVLLPEEKQKHLAAPWLYLSLDLDDAKQAKMALLQIAGYGQEALAKLDKRAVGWTFRLMRKSDNPTQSEFELAKALTNAHYLNDPEIGREGGYSGLYADGLVRRGKYDEAQALLLQYPRLGSWESVHVDALYVPLRTKARFARRFNLQTAYDGDLQFWQKAVIAHPDSLAARLELIRFLRIGGDNQQALEVAQAAKERIANPPDTDKPAFTDLDDKQKWLLNDLSYVLIDLGRPDEGIESMKAASAMEEGNGINVSQTINLASMQLRLGRYNQVLESLADMKPDSGASPYGLAFVYSLRACAHYELGQNIQADAKMSQLTKYKEENHSAWRTALVCLNRQEEAARAYASDLADPLERHEVLMGLQHWKIEPNRSPWLAQMMARREQIISRPEVQAAIAKAGIITDMPFYATYWGEF